MAGREDIRYQLAAITHWYRLYDMQDQVMKHGKTEEERWAAYDRKAKSEEMFYQLSRWFIDRHVPLGYDERAKEYYALTDPPLRLDMEAFLEGRKPPSEHAPGSADQS